MRRAFTLFLCVLTIITLVLSLSSCGESKEKFRARYADEDVPTYVGALLSTNENYKLRFIAASRGYDISPKDNETVLQDIEDGALALCILGCVVLPLSPFLSQK